MKKAVFHKIQYSSKNLKEIVADWKAQFPMLSHYNSPTVLSMCADLVQFTLSIEDGLNNSKLFRDPVELDYRVRFECLSLWGEGDRGRYLFLSELQDERGDQFFIKYQLHDYYLDKAIEQAKLQFGGLLQEKVPASALIKFADNSYRTYHTWCRHAAGGDVIRRYKLKMALALYFDDKAVMAAVRKSLDMEARFWDDEYFLEVFKMTLQQWKDELYRSFDDREAFMVQIHENITNPKVAQLREGHIIWDVTPKDIKVPSRLSLYWWRLQYKWFKYSKRRWMRKQGLE